jgi:hypothetical protein
MRFATLSTPTYSTPRMAGLQAQASTANVAPQKAEAFTPSGRIQRQGKTTRKHVEMLIAAIDKHLRNPLRVWWLGIHFPGHRQRLESELEGLKKQLGDNKIGKVRYLLGIDLSLFDLAGADFAGTNLTKVKLNGANLHGTNLKEAELHGANLKGAFGVPLGITPEQLASARNIDVLAQCKALDERGNDSVLRNIATISPVKEGNPVTNLIGKLEQRRQAKVRELLGLG